MHQSGISWLVPISVFIWGLTCWFRQRLIPVLFFVVVFFFLFYFSKGYNTQQIKCCPWLTKQFEIYQQERNCDFNSAFIDAKWWVVWDVDLPITNPSHAIKEYLWKWRTLAIKGRNTEIDIMWKSQREKCYISSTNIAFKTWPFISKT